MKFVFLGLAITSSWGNGHATTYRALLGELLARRHEVLFLERDVPWYAPHRDLTGPLLAQVRLYGSLDDLRDTCRDEVAAADVVVVGSYVPDGIAVAEWVLTTARGTTAFYDIDTPITLVNLVRSGDVPPNQAYLTPALIPRFDLYLSFTGGPTLGIIERRFGARRALPLYCSVDPMLYAPEKLLIDADLGYMGTYSADRQPGLEDLLLAPAREWQRGRFIVAGPQYPSEIDWPPNVVRREHVPPADHPTFYNQLRFTLNLTRADMKRAGWSPSVRLFEAAACGTAIISDTWPGLETFFTIGREILVSTSTVETLRLLRAFPESQRLLLGQRARKRVLAEHTAGHRAEQLLSYVTGNVSV